MKQNEMEHKNKTNKLNIYSVITSGEKIYILIKHLLYNNTILFVF